MLLDGDITLTERVPLELHVNTCGECRQRLADLQMFKDMPQSLERQRALMRAERG